MIQSERFRGREIYKNSQTDKDTGGGGGGGKERGIFTERCGTQFDRMTGGLM